MAIATELIKELRQRTGAGVLDCKTALEATAGDIEKAVAYLREKGLAKAAKKSGRTANEGLIEPYSHAGGRIAALVELNCETDFVARTEEFRALAHNIAMQVVASNPQYLAPQDVPAEVVGQEKAVYAAEFRDSGKPEHIVDRIVEGRLKKFYGETCLLEQPFIKDGDKTVGELIQEHIAKLGENIKLRRFVRYELGN